ncbi:tyrosine-type recombinase/integrase [Fusobacterium sp.]|uniref:tyrosine-type recombinase/integrase n=1 Tax=Fusobacterium sp. TaxID=68766 RepID=UPI002617A276|nr:tyrosine-type recombinase/integrase [Fusobacterium sp.]
MDFTLFEKYIKEFLFYSEFSEEKSRNTIISIKKDLEQLRDFLMGEKDIEDITKISPIMIRGFLLKMQKDNIGKRSLSRKLSSVKIFFRYLKKNGVIKIDPTQTVSAPSFQVETPDILSLDEIQKLRDIIDTTKCSGLRDRLIIELLFSSGITSQELLSLGESVFNLEDRELVVISGKNSRVVFFSERAREYFKRYVEAKKEKFKERYNKDILFVNNSATRLSDRSLRRLIDRYALAAGITREISPYSFRHTFGAYMISHGMDIFFLKELLGHINIETTKMYQEIIKKPTILKSLKMLEE